MNNSLSAMVGLAALSVVLSSFASPLSGPEHHRLFKRTVYLAEIPLAHAYSNGNLWTGYAHRWTDWPLMIDRSLKYYPGYNYRHTIPDLQRQDEVVGAEGGRDLRAGPARRREVGARLPAQRPALQRRQLEGRGPAVVPARDDQPPWHLLSRQADCLGLS